MPSHRHLLASLAWGLLAGAGPALGAGPQSSVSCYLATPSSTTLGFALSSGDEGAQLGSLPFTVQCSDRRAAASVLRIVEPSGRLTTDTTVFMTQASGARLPVRAQLLGQGSTALLQVSISAHATDRLPQGHYVGTFLLTLDY